MKIRLVFIFLISNISVLFSYTPWVEYNGASSINSIKVIGNKVWCATGSGLTVYDKQDHSITHFKKAKGEASGTYAANIVSDSLGNIWVGYYDGVSKFDGTTWTNYFVSSTNDTMRSLGKIAIDKHGKVWGVGEYVFYIDSTGLHTITPQNIINNLYFPGIMDLDCDTNDNLYIATQKYGILKYDGISWSAYDTTNTPVFSNYAIAVQHDNTGKMWSVYRENSISNIFHIYSTDGTNWIDYPASNLNSDFQPNAIYVGEDDKKYFYDTYAADSCGLFIYNDTTWTTISFASGAFSSPFIRAMYFDSDGILWTNSFFCMHCGYDEAGTLTSWDGNIKNEINIAENPFNQIQKLFKDHKGNVYGMGYTGIYQFKNYGWLNISPPTTILDNYYSDAVFDNNDNLWVSGEFPSGTQGFFAMLDNSGWTSFNSGMSYIHDMSVDMNNNLWISGSPSLNNASLIKFDGINTTLFTSSNTPLLGNGIGNLKIDASGNIWGTQSSNNAGAVLKFDGANWQKFDSSNSAVRGYGEIFTTPSGKIFLFQDIPTSLYKRMFRFDGIDFVYDSLINSIDPNGCYFLEEDALGRLWFSTGMHNGIYIFNDSALEKQLHVMNSGLPSSTISSLVFSGSSVWMTNSSVVSIYNEEGLPNMEAMYNRRFSGNVFFDIDSNGVKDIGEDGMPLQKIIILEDSSFSYSNSSGDYSIYRDTNSYELEFIPYPGWNITSDSNSYHCLADTADIDSLDFGAMNAQPQYKLEVNMSLGITRCGRITNLWATIKNTGTVSESGIILITIDSNVTYISSTPTPDSIISNVLYYSFSTLNPFQSKNIGILILLPPNPGININFECVANSTSNIATDHTNQIVVCSFDPNDKVVFPTGTQLQHFTLISDTIDYLIHFQNTGTDTAFKIIIFDSLDASLIDINSFEFLSSSNPCYVQVEQSGVVRFTFDPILLPQKSTDEPGSEGFVRFRIRPRGNLTSGSILKNKAYIVFDFNTAIVTNETMNTMVNLIPNGINELSVSEHLTIYPNPTTGRLFIKTELSNYFIQVFNILGECISNSVSNDSNSEIDLSVLPSGIYLLVVSNAEINIKARFIKQ